MFVGLPCAPACRNVLDLDGDERQRLGLDIRVHESFAVKLPEPELLAALVIAVERALDVELALRVGRLRRIRDRGAAFDEAVVQHFEAHPFDLAFARLATARAAPLADHEAQAPWARSKMRPSCRPSVCI